MDAKASAARTTLSAMVLDNSDPTNATNLQKNLELSPASWSRIFCVHALLREADL
eukprot:m.58088 g.58088  ORF g.58088 m.58088 type:complete len:55 (+) comp12822_c0_seq1:1337-1501(+)